jgi:hypothetical protein
MIFIEDLVGDPGAVDATKDFDKGVTIGLRKIRRESTIAGSGKKTLEKSSWDVIAHELDFVLEATLDCDCEDGTDGEQEKVVILAAYAVSASGGGGVTSIAQRRADILSKL